MTTQPPGTAACLVRDNAGVRPLDAIDQAYVATVKLSGCVVGPLLTVTRSGIGSGAVNSNPAGIGCGSDCSESYVAGTQVTLSAVAAVGSTFAGWSGDADCADGIVNLNANTSCNAVFNLAPLSQTITFGTLASKTLLQSPIAISATASSGLPVTFASLTPAVCATSGPSPASVTLLATGTCTVSASQAGNAIYNAAPTVNRSFGVTKASQTISFAPLATRTLLQSPVIVSATASSGLTVTFNSTTPAICFSGGTNGATITLLAPGTCTVRATQPGDFYYNAAPAVNRSFAVTKVSQTITFAPLANRALADSPLTVAATSTSGLPVTFITTTLAVCTAGGTNGATITLLAKGTCTVRATQAGDAIYAPAPAVSRSFIVS